MRQPYRILIAFVGSAVLAYAAYESGTRGLADWRTMRWRHAIAGWAEHPTIPEPENLPDAFASLIDAVALTPDDPNLIENLALLHQLRATASAVGGDAWRLNFTRALEYQRKASALRPTSSYTWANIALAKYRLGQIDGEFSAAMRHALDFGPWEPSVQLIVADTGLGAWEKLDGGMRERVTGNLQRTAMRQADTLARIATFHHRADVVCAAALEAMKNKLECVR